MKKVLFKVLCGLLAVTILLSLSACGKKDKWSGTNMTNPGNVVSVGGFVAETENYLYYINGIGSSTESNTFGAPIKGSLMAVAKADLGKSEIPTEIVVPKLFVANDYSAGVYIYGGYVYYGTPSTDKTPEGTVANSEMMFMKTKLDGTDSKVLFSIDTLTAQYRIVEKDGTVYIVYYDATNSELISYNTANKAKAVIAKTDAKTEGTESLNSYYFVDNGSLADAVVLYTTTIYTEKYNEEKVEAGVARATANYNKVYAYKVGAENGEVVLDGKVVENDEVVEENTYAITLVDGENVFYSVTNKFGSVKNKGLKIADLVAKNTATEIVAEYAVAGNLIKSFTEVYVLDTEAGRIYKDTMVKPETPNYESKKLVAQGSTFGSLIDVIGEYVYYYNNNNEIAKLKLNDADAKEIRVSAGSANTSWYAPEFITVDSITYMFYCDNSSTGISYIKFVNINGTPVEKDTDDDGEKDLFYLDGVKFVGQMITADKADLFESKINAIADGFENGNLVFEVKEGALVVEEVANVRAEYDDLDKEIKEEVSETAVETLEKYERAIKIANLFYKLDGVKDYASKTDAEKQAIKDAYNSVKADLVEFYNSSDYSEINALIENDLKANYTKAVKLFEE